MYVTKGQIEQARRTDLYAFLLARHGEAFTKEGRSLRMKGNRSVSIKEGHHAYRDFSNNEYGNSITFLTGHMGYGFQDAVAALCGASIPAAALPEMPSPPLSAGKIVLPDPAPLPHRRMYGFLMGRGIPKDVIARLASCGLAYQSAVGNNVVFVNKERDYCELRGTCTYSDKSFHGCRKARADRFWYFIPGSGKPETAYITEGAIDAISLFLIRKRSGADVSRSVYISIGGVSNHATIDRIKKRIHTVLAVDNDRAGEFCRTRHGELECIIPSHKDWNDDLRDAVWLRN